MKTVALLEPIHNSGIRLLKDHARVHLLSGPEDPALASALAESDALIVRSLPVGSDLLALGPRLRVIGRHGAGVDNIDHDYAARRGIRIVNTPRSNTQSVAEFTVTAILYLFKRIAAVQDALRAGAVTTEGGSMPGQIDRLGLAGREVAGAQLGVIGAGAIGRSVADLARALGMRVLAYDPFVDPEILNQSGIQSVAELPTLLRSSDVVSIHVPGGLHEQPLIGPTELAAMKPTGFLINAARGGLIDESALSTALIDGTIAGAAVDVYSHEPPPADSPLFSAPNLLMTPHIAAITDEALERMAVDVARFTLKALESSVHR